MKGNQVDCMLLRVARSGAGGRPAELAAGLADAGARSVQEVRLAADPTAVDAALDELGDRRLVVAGSTPELQLVLSRLLRSGRLDSVPTAVVSDAPPAYLRVLGLPSDEAGQLQRAVGGTPRKIGVIKDDSGGLCVDAATVTPWTKSSGNSADSTASRWWLRAVVDDEPLCDGPARAVSLRRLGPAELEATVRLGRWRTRTIRGRSLQLACEPALVIQDGVERERSRTKRTFWSEPALWNLCL